MASAELSDYETECQSSDSSIYHMGVKEEERNCRNY